MNDSRFANPIYKKKSWLIVFLSFTMAFSAWSQEECITRIQSQAISTTTADKPQSKVWKHDGNWFCVFPTSDGTKIWKLDKDKWEETLHISAKTNSKADCVPHGKFTFILLFQNTSSQFTVVKYNDLTRSYEFSDKNNPIIPISFPGGTETCVIDIDGLEHLWMTYEANNNIYVRNSSPPYKFWSLPHCIATGVKDDDISSVIQMNGKIGVLWSDQNTGFFGFKTHLDGDPITEWSQDEQPASQSALNIGGGMADDHINMKFSNGGRLYCAIKTSYDTLNQPKIGLLIRNKNGSWDDLYPVSNSGTRPVCSIDEINQTLKIIYTETEAGGDIIYRQSGLGEIEFGDVKVLLKGSTYNNTSSSKRPNYGDAVVVASGNKNIVGVRLKVQNRNGLNPNNGHKMKNK